MKRPPKSVVAFEVEALETAGLVRLMLEGPGGMKVGSLLSAGEAHDLGAQLVNAGTEVALA
jgi:hypothetical protein